MKKVSDQLRASLQQSSASASAGLGASSDLQQVLNSFTGEKREREQGRKEELTSDDLCCRQDIFWAPRQGQQIPAHGEAAVC